MMSFNGGVLIGLVTNQKIKIKMNNKGTINEQENVFEHWTLSN
jgi:hypothetical protein